MDYLNSLDSLAEMVEKKTIDAVCSQLKDLVDKGILKIVTGEKQFVQDINSATIQYKNSIKIELDQADYIQNLEYQINKLMGENKSLKTLINQMCSVVSEKPVK